MNCPQADEFASALCDGDRIPYEAANHIQSCAACRTALTEYSMMGADLRCSASLTPPDKLPVVVWESVGETNPQGWWRKGWETMRVPRIAVALVLLVIAALSSGLAILKAQTATTRQILVLTIKATGGFGDGTIQCTMLTETADGSPCYVIQVVKSGALGIAIRLAKTDRDRFELSVRYKFLPNQIDSHGKVNIPSLSYPFKDLASWPEQQYWLVPDQELHIDAGSAGTLILSADLPDPAKAIVSSAASAKLTPDQGELRLISPVLLQGKNVVFDSDGAAASIDNGMTGCVYVYAPGLGRFILSLYPIDGAIEGRIEWTRIRFAMNGKSYQFATGSPVANSERIWILPDPDYKPSMQDPHARDDQPFVGASDLKALRFSPKIKPS